MDIKPHFVRWQGKAVEISKAPLDALAASVKVLELKDPHGELCKAIQAEIKARQAAGTHPSAA